MDDMLLLYKKGLERLLIQLDEEEHSAFSEVETYQARLLENLSLAALHGDTEILRATRSQIIKNLNEVTHKFFKMSFVKYCVSNISSTFQETSDTQLSRTSNVNDVVDCRQKISNIEYLLAVTNPLLFTIESISRFIDQTSEAIIVVRDKLDKITYDTQELSKNLHEARVNLILAIEERTKGKTARYCKYLRVASECLEIALIIWKTPN